MTDDGGTVIDLAAERARRQVETEPLVAALVITYTMGTDGIPTCRATFSVDNSTISDGAAWLTDWLPATAQHLLDVAAQQRAQ